jgi:hypothetical protein
MKTFRDELADLDPRVEEPRRSALGLQWEKARAAARVKAYTSITFSKYLRYVLLGSGL